MADYTKNPEKQDFEQQDAFEERVIEIARVAKVVKGGRRFQFRVTVVVGDKKGTIGMGVGKANAVPDAMRKASERARKDLRQVNLSGTTVPHEVIGKVAGARVFLKPASSRYRRYRRRRRACRAGSGRGARHPDQVHGLRQCAQRGDGDLCRARPDALSAEGSRPPRQAC